MTAYTWQGGSVDSWNNGFAAAGPSDATDFAAPPQSVNVNSGNGNVDSIAVDPNVNVEFSGSATISSKALLDDGNIVVDGNASLTTAGGATANGVDGGGNLGTAPGRTGTIDVTGTTASWIVNSYLNIGQLGMTTGGMQTGGTGHMTVEGGATVNLGTDNQSVDYTAVSAGSSLTIEGAATTVNLHDLNLAGGTFDLNTGAALNVAGDAGDGGVAGPSAIYVNDLATVDDGTIDANGNIVVGNSNADGAIIGHTSGILNISDGSQVDAEALVIGYGEIGLGGQGRVTIDGAGTDVRIDAQGETGDRSGLITVGDTGTGNLTVSDGASLETSGAAAIGGLVGGGGIMFVQGQGSTFDVTGNLAVGVESNGALMIEDGGAVTAGSLDVGSIVDDQNNEHGHGTITITGDDSALTVGDGDDGATTIGDQGIGEVDIEDGGAFTANGEDFVIGNFAGSEGTLSVDGDNSTFDYDGDIIVGQGGQGTLTLSGEVSYEAAGDITAGREDGSEGTINIQDDGTQLTEDGDLTLGDAGTGNLNLTDSAQLVVVGNLEEGVQDGSDGADDIEGDETTFNVQSNWTIGVAGAHDDTISGVQHATVSGDLVLGEEDGGDGSLTLSGEDTTLTVIGEFKIGEGGKGSFSVEDGTTFDASDKDVTLGEDDTGDGTLTISGEGSSVSFQSLTVGGEGTGEVDLSDDGTLDVSGDITVGESDGSTGTINADAEFSVNSITVGAEGTGTLIVTDTTTINDEIVVGESDGSTGTVTVNGGGTLEIDTSVKIGAEGTGTLRVQLGGSATAEETTVAESSGSSGEIDVDGDNSSVQVTSLTIGSAGAATVSITNGGRLVATDDVTVADQVNSNIDSVTVDGGSSFGADRDLTIGGSAIATFDVKDGSTLTVDGAVVIGDTTSGDGTLTISGSSFDPDIGADRSSSLGFGQTLTVGNQGIGTLNIFDGALVGSVAGGPGTVEIGAAAGGNGNVYVGDAGTNFNTGAVSIGGTDAQAGGQGTLTVENDGTVTAGAVKIWGDGALVLSGDGEISATGYDVVTGGTISGDGEITGEIDNAGSVTAMGGTLIVDDAITNDGSIGAVSGRLLVGGEISASAAHFGEVVIGDGGTVEFAGPVAADQFVDFSATKATLQIDQQTSFQATVDDFRHGDIIDLHSITYDARDTAKLEANNVLHVAQANGVDIIDIQLDPDADDSGAIFSLLKDSTGGMDVETSAVACYCRGTLIATVRGNVAVEDLRIGDGVIVMSGQVRPIKWIGRRSYGGRFVVGRTDILPICINAGSIADDVPKRDLWISPHHAMYLDGVLIEARDLVNGISIVQAEQVDHVEYFHIELDSHDVIVAEGALSETFVDDESRGMFHNAHDFALLYPEAIGKPARYCAPRVDHGYEVEAVRQRLVSRAGLLPTADRPGAGALRGYVDLVSAGRIAGWAQSIDHTEVPVCLDIVASGRLIGQVLANRFRDDLRRAGLGSGRHGFEFMVPAGLVLASQVVEVRRSLDGAALEYLANPVRRELRSTAA